MEEKKEKIKFGSEIDFGKQIKLIEVDEEMIKELESNNNLFILRGFPSSEAILCDNHHSFQMRMVESTNSLFLFPPSSSSSSSSSSSIESNELIISSSIQCHFELIKNQPRLDILRQLLYNNPLQREGDESKEGKITMKELKERVQASDSQIEKGLKELGAFEYDGFIQVLDEDWEDDIIENLILEVISNDWNFSSVPNNQIISLLDSIASKVAISNALSKLGKRNGDNWILSPKQIAIYKAKKLFKTKQSWVLDDFMNEWASSIPDGSQPSVSMLEGFVVTKKDPNVIEWLPAHTLPFDTRQRMKLLFEKKNFWNTKEIEPYIRYKFIYSMFSHLIVLLLIETSFLLL
eukprot:TRINITY_DN1408_c0_g1_i3.p2 TRINITY_DN1408_c0_g1~~TRINITY_DN1408_c0_g1_i3.p2  ORF type:complete len:349 (+),score=127.54 TRINITY_DN1408_c0_g1_i3:124-1170(+)